MNTITDLSIDEIEVVPSTAPNSPTVLDLSLEVASPTPPNSPELDFGHYDNDERISPNNTNSPNNNTTFITIAEVHRENGHIGKITANLDYNNNKTLKKTRKRKRTTLTPHYTLTKIEEDDDPITVQEELETILQDLANKNLKLEDKNERLELDNEKLRKMNETYRTEIKKLTNQLQKLTREKKHTPQEENDTTSRTIENTQNNYSIERTMNALTTNFSITTNEIQQIQSLVEEIHTIDEDNECDEAHTRTDYPQMNTLKQQRKLTDHIRNMTAPMESDTGINRELYDINRRQYTPPNGFKDQTTRDYLKTVNAMSKVLCKNLSYKINSYIKEIERTEMRTPRLYGICHFIQNRAKHLKHEEYVRQRNRN